MSHNGFQIIPVQLTKFYALTDFFNKVKNNKFFHPHPFTLGTACELWVYDGKNSYYTIMENEKIIGYGFLRGFEEGWKDICLGIYILDRRKGLGELLMNFLHIVAKRQGLKRLRLHVHPDNKKALNLYRKMDYEFKDGKHNGELIGCKTL